MSIAKDGKEIALLERRILEECRRDQAWVPPLRWLAVFRSLSIWDRMFAELEGGPPDSGGGGGRKKRGRGARRGGGGGGGAKKNMEWANSMALWLHIHSGASDGTCGRRN